MDAKDIIAQEVARQAEFGMEPGWVDFVIAGQKAGIKEVTREIDLPMLIDWIRRCEVSLKDDNMSIALVVAGLENITKYLVDRQLKLKEWGLQENK